MCSGLTHFVFCMVSLGEEALENLTKYKTMKLLCCNYEKVQLNNGNARNTAQIYS